MYTQTRKGQHWWCGVSYMIRRLSMFSLHPEESIAIESV